MQAGTNGVVEGVGCVCEKEGQRFGLITVTMGAAKRERGGKKRRRTCAMAGLSCSHLFQ